MREKPDTCEFCKFLGNIPFAAESDEDIIGICENVDSSYADCECCKKDTCESFESKLI